jgi:hypothetical protein
MGHHAVLVSARAACAPCQRMLPLQRLRVGPAERVSSRQRDYLLEQPRANRSYDRIADAKCEGILEKIHAGEQKPGEKDTFQRQIRPRFSPGPAQRAFVREKVNLSTYPAHPRLPVPRPWIAKGGTRGAAVPPWRATTPQLGPMHLLPAGGGRLTIRGSRPARVGGHARPFAGCTSCSARCWC